LKIQSVHNHSSELFKDFVQKHNLFFHSPAWVNCYGSELHQYVILNNNDEIIGCFLLYQYQKAFLKFIISPPFTPGIALFFVNPALTVVNKNSFSKEVMSLLAQFVNDLKAHVVDVLLDENFTDAQPFIWKNFKVSPRFSYHINLNYTDEEIYERLSSEKRKSISKAEKDGLKVLPIDDHLIMIKYITASLHKGGVLSNEKILEGIIQTLAQHPQAIALQAILDGKIRAISVSVVDQNKCIYLFGGYDHQQPHHGAGVSCMWHSIKYAKHKGAHIFDFEGSMHPGIERYYREFGGTMFTSHQIRFTAHWLKLFKRFR